MVTNELDESIRKLVAEDLSNASAITILGVHLWNRNCPTSRNYMYRDEFEIALRELMEKLKCQLNQKGSPKKDGAPRRSKPIQKRR